MPFSDGGPFIELSRELAPADKLNRCSEFSAQMNESDRLRDGPRLDDRHDRYMLLLLPKN